MFNLTSGSSEKNLSFERKVSSVLSNLHSKRPRNFWSIFFQKAFFFNLVSSLSEDFSSFVKKLSTKLSKLNFTCPVKHFDQNIMLILWNNFRLWARNCRIWGRKFAALLIKLLFCLQMGNWKNSFEGNFTFFDIFRTSREPFWFFPCFIPRMVVQTEFHQPRGTYPLRGKLGAFLSFPDYERNF